MVMSRAASYEFDSFCIRLDDYRNIVPLRYLLDSIRNCFGITLTQKLRIRHLIIEASNFKENSELQTPTVN